MICGTPAKRRRGIPCPRPTPQAGSAQEASVGLTREGGNAISEKLPGLLWRIPAGRFAYIMIVVLMAAVIPGLILPIPLLAIHVLWISLMTDRLPRLALATEPAEKGIMQRPPRLPAESIFAGGMWQRILWVGFATAGVCLFAQARAIESDSAHWQTIVFTIMTLSQMGLFLALRSMGESNFSLGGAPTRRCWARRC